MHAINNLHLNVKNTVYTLVNLKCVVSKRPAVKGHKSHIGQKKCFTPKYTENGSKLF